MTSAPRLDQIAIELLRNAFHSICDEMAESLVRSSHSPNIKERRDCSCALYNATGEIAVQAEHIPTHLGVMAGALGHVLDAYPLAGIRPGDAFLVNDPYYGANHLPDFIVVGPVFAAERIVGFAASMAHHTDVGGMTPRSMPASATEIFHEGLRIPPVQLCRDGVLDRNLCTLIAANSRLPEERMADLAAQVATIQVAQQRVDELARRYSADTLRLALDEIIQVSEMATRACIRALPDSVWRGLAYADFGPQPIPLNVCVRRTQTDGLLIDFAGSGEQTHSPFNSCLANTLACVYLAIRITVAQGIPANQGMYRALTIRIPEGSILNPRFPAAISAATQVAYHTFEALMNALAALAPDQVLAGTGGGGVFSFGGTHPTTGRLFAYGEALGGGSGASAFADGESGMIPPVANLHDTPVEVLEMSLPVRLERYELVEDSGGAGRYRGGFGLRRAFRMLTPVRCSFQVSMPSRGPSGLMGAGSGTPTRIRVASAEGVETFVDRFTELTAPAGTLIEIETAGGGGYGEAAERTPHDQAEDVRLGYGYPRPGVQP